MRRLLFVDDEPSVLQGLRRMLHPLRDEWEMTFVENGPDALTYMASHQTDVIVTDMRMPQMNGAQLLARVRELYPGTIRFILSGHSDRELIMQSVGSAHRYLAKPCDPTLLVGTVEHSFAIQKMVHDDRIRSKIMSLKALPLLPATYQQLLAALSSDKSSIDSIAEIVGRDIGMTAKILHLINSAFFGRSTHVDRINRAVSLLGLETVRSLVLTTGVFEQFAGVELAGLTLEGVYSHCLAVGALSAKVARMLKHEKDGVDSALLAGMMHDVGKAILLTKFRDQMKVAIARAGGNPASVHLVEEDIIGVTHAEIGAYLISLWGESHDKVEAVALHHHPGRTRRASSNALTAVHIANALVRRAEYDDQETWQTNELDIEYLTPLGLMDLVLDMAEEYRLEPEKAGG
jgi:putative nucleotidyltransferase with HDIG domain